MTDGRLLREQSDDRYWLSADVTCPSCNGRGSFRETRPGPHGGLMNGDTVCSRCDGSGSL